MLPKNEIRHYKGRLHIKGKSYTKLKALADDYGLSLQNLVTGLLWECIMRDARVGLFKKVTK